MHRKSFRIAAEKSLSQNRRHCVLVESVGPRFWRIGMVNDTKGESGGRTTWKGSDSGCAAMHDGKSEELVNEMHTSAAR